MRVTKFTKNLTVSLDEETYHKIKQMTSVRGISMMDWLRRLIDEELQHLSFEEDTIESDQETDEDEQLSSESPSNNNEEFDLRKLVLGDDDTTEKDDEIE